jgi:hypothetical protein
MVQEIRCGMTGLYRKNYNIIACLEVHDHSHRFTMVVRGCNSVVRVYILSCVCMRPCSRLYTLSTRLYYIYVSIPVCTYIARMYVIYKKNRVPVLCMFACGAMGIVYSLRYTYFHTMHYPTLHSLNERRQETLQIRGTQNKNTSYK